MRGHNKEKEEHENELRIVDGNTSPSQGRIRNTRRIPWFRKVDMSFLIGKIPKA